MNWQIDCKIWFDHAFQYFNMMDLIILYKTCKNLKNTILLKLNEINSNASLLIEYDEKKNIYYSKYLSPKYFIENTINQYILNNKVNDIVNIKNPFILQFRNISFDYKKFVNIESNVYYLSLVNCSLYNIDFCDIYILSEYNIISNYEFYIHNTVRRKMDESSTVNSFFKLFGKKKWDNFFENYIREMYSLLYYLFYKTNSKNKLHKKIREFISNINMYEKITDNIDNDNRIQMNTLINMQQIFRNYDDLEKWFKNCNATIFNLSFTCIPNNLVVNLKNCKFISAYQSTISCETIKKLKSSGVHIIDKFIGNNDLPNIYKAEYIIRNSNDINKCFEYVIKYIHWTDLLKLKMICKKWKILIELFQPLIYSSRYDKKINFYQTIIQSEFDDEEDNYGYDIFKSMLSGGAFLNLIHLNLDDIKINYKFLILIDNKCLSLNFHKTTFIDNDINYVKTINDIEMWFASCEVNYIDFSGSNINQVYLMNMTRCHTIKIDEKISQLVIDYLTEYNVKLIY